MSTLLALWMMPVVLSAVWIAPALRTQLETIEMLRVWHLDPANPAVGRHLPLTWETAR